MARKTANRFNLRDGFTELSFFGIVVTPDCRMSPEKTKMLAGELYDPGDEELRADRLRARTRCQELNTLGPTELVRKREILDSLFHAKVNASVTPPFFCDYGYNIELGDEVYFNFNCVILDVARVTIGKNTLFGPAVQIYAATHPLDAVERRTGLEMGKPISIGEDVWVGGGAIIFPGVTIGDGSIIGAGSIVTHDVPSKVVAAGNPCRIIREL